MQAGEFGGYTENRSGKRCSSCADILDMPNPGGSDVNGKKEQKQTYKNEMHFKLHAFLKTIASRTYIIWESFVWWTWIRIEVYIWETNQLDSLKIRSWQDANLR